MNSPQPRLERQSILRMLLATVLSLFFSGAGQIYNGQIKKGIAFIVGSFLLWFFFLGWVVNLWAAVDAGLVRARLEKKASGETVRSRSEEQMK